MKRFAALQEERGEKAFKQAIDMGLKYAGFGYWKDPQTGETKFKTENDTLVPVEPDVESEKYTGGKPGEGGGTPDFAGGPDQMGGGMKNAAGMLQMPGGGQAMAGQGIQGAPQPGEEQVAAERGWEPGPDGDTCVGPDAQAPGKVPEDAYVGRTNFLKWGAGPDGDNMTTVSYAQVREMIESVDDNSGPLKGPETFKGKKMQVAPQQTAKRKSIADNMNSEFKKLNMVKNPNYNMDKTYETGRELGEGIQGRVVLDEKNNTVVKKGNIGSHELEALDRMKDNPNFPSLINARFDGPFANQDPVRNNPRGTDPKRGKFYQDHNYGSNFYTKFPGAPGMFAMTAAKGEELASYPYADDDEVQHNITKKMHQLRRDMHKQGIAHNDMHEGNVFYDEDADQMHLLDFGLAHVSPIRALLEGLGGINGASPMDIINDIASPSEKGDFQLSDTMKGHDMRQSPYFDTEQLGAMFDGNVDNIEEFLLDQYDGDFEDEDGYTNYMQKVNRFLKGGIRLNKEELRDIIQGIPYLTPEQGIEGEFEGEYEPDDDRVMKMIDMLYDGLEETPLPKDASTTQRMSRAYDKLVDKLGDKNPDSPMRGQAALDMIKTASKFRQEKGKKPINVKGLDIGPGNEKPSRIPSKRRVFDKITDMDD